LPHPVFFRVVINFEQRRLAKSRTMEKRPISALPPPASVAGSVTLPTETPARQERAMGSIHYLGRSLDPEAMRVIGAAFDRAWQDLAASGSIFSARFPADRACGQIAMRITSMAQRGERDPDQLTEDALDYVARRASPRGEQR
jgi:hypothetical protein